MEKFVINGVEFTDFGVNKYSCGMHRVTAYPVNDNMIDDVAHGKYPGIYVNPLHNHIDDGEFFGLMGTPEQYERFLDWVYD